MIKIVERLRAGTPVRTFRIDLPLGEDGHAQPNASYVAAAMRRPGANFKFPGDRRPYSWRVRDIEASGGPGK
ncbi:MAG: hypothetical protein A2623_08770 [Caulobacterales bacterium RIFCSPHIGHO2_01_FULL_70_19]|nr:MAG: hypothetical protein A2623_08770 [Caulobacterales bacterium RIFCSPHIGHO2_01_FULL_70_19]